MNMAEIRKLPWFRHLRAEPTSHILAYREGVLKRSGCGLSFWFLPMGAAIAEVPVDDRDQPFLFSGRTRDFQQVHVQGVITFRVASAEKLASRVDFAIDHDTGQHRRQPLDQLSALLTGFAQRIGLRHIARLGVRELLTEGLAELQRAIEEGLSGDESLKAMGLEVVTARVYDLKPTAELEKALQTPTRESLQQTADQATFERRALAVEKERAIAENELKNQIELARREEELIAQRGQNERHRMQDEVDAKRIDALALAERTRVEGEATAGRIRLVEHAKADTEKLRLDAYRDLPAPVLIGLAVQELAGKLQIEHLNITPDLLGPILNRVLQAGARRLEHE
jgi:regulator of protease activity HflC (stomatin/prohibitin superfamily)